jgi:hypothetical protein
VRLILIHRIWLHGRLFGELPERGEIRLTAVRCPGLNSSLTMAED